MAILDKIKTITSVFGRLIPGRSGFGGYNCGYPQSGGIFQVSKDALIAFIEKYKGVRRLILAIVLWINIHIFLVTTHMYKLYASIDMQWVIFAGYWSAILATFVAFYTMARTNEFNSYTPYSRPGEWMHSQSQIGVSTYSATEYTEEDNPSLYNDDVIEYTEPEEIDGDMMVEEGVNNVGNQ